MRIESWIVERVCSKSVGVQGTVGELLCLEIWCQAREEAGQQLGQPSLAPKNDIVIVFCYYCARALFNSNAQTSAISTQFITSIEDGISFILQKEDLRKKSQYISSQYSFAFDCLKETDDL